MSDDKPRRDPIAEQNEAAKRFEERTGRKSTDPAPPGVMRMGIGPDGRVQAETFGYDRDPDDEFDPFQRAGIDRVHHSPSEIEETPTAVVGHFKGGTDLRGAVAKVFVAADSMGMFSDSVEVSASGYARTSKYADAIEADSYERLNSESISASG